MRAGETHGADTRRSDDRRTRSRAPRRVAKGSIGFGQVYALVKKGAKPAADEPGARRSAAQESVAVPTALLLDLHQVQQAAGTPTAGDAQARVTEAGTQRSDLLATQQQLGAMAPKAALQAIVDQARDMDMQADARELQIELDPAHLGPMIVKIRVEKGRITTELVAREARAARLLGSGSAGLRDRLLALGYSEADVTVAHDETGELT